MEQLDGKDIISKRSSINPLSIKCLEREFTVISELQSRGLALGLLPNQNDNFEVKERSIEFERKGTHDLSDLGHDLTVGEFFDIVAKLAVEISKIHEKGFVHRDIKPGNIMVTQKLGNNTSGKTYAGIVDFGMALKINRKQDEEGVAGGTRPFYHPSQMLKDERSSPGQDWYSLALTCLYFMRSSVNAMEAEINSTSNGVKINFIDLVGASQKTISLEDILHTNNEHFFTLLTNLIQKSTSVNCDLDEITDIGKSLAEAAGIFVKNKSSRKIVNKNNPLPLKGNCIAKHDLLLIIDETNSLASEIERIKNTIEEVIQEFDGTMDLRVDLWTVRDYARKNANGDSHQTVRKVGYRLTARALPYAIGEIAADAEQHDEAEAYEMAFEEAVGNLSKKVRREGRWFPRNNSTRTVVLAGDAYAHGWLRKPWWFVWLGMIKKGAQSEIDRKSRFEKNHPGAFDTYQIDRENSERESRLRMASDSVDQFGGTEEFVPNSKGGKQYRPNVMKVTERLRDNKKCTIHTICLGDDIVTKSYMKYVACLGNGVTIEGKNDFVDALVGIIASPDKLLYQKLLEKKSISQTAKQNLTPLTTFVLDDNTEHLK